LDWIERILGLAVFWRNFWRRGVHVNTLEIGSRGGEKCLGGI
jgi:hypothetical protein